MSLKEKLGSLTQKLETAKVEKKQTEQDEQLKPVRANIKKLETSRKSLDLLKNSLDFKELNRPDEHVGMKDYAEKTSKKLKAKSGEIDTLISENKEALDTLGIKDMDKLAEHPELARDQLSEHPEFAEEPEVIEYKKATEQDQGLKISDAKLKERLTKLGVEFDAENFSYESASKAVGSKLENLDKELTQEKIRTPEGREEIVNNLAEEFEKSSGKMELNSVSSYDKNNDPGGANRNQPDFSYGFGTDRQNFSIDFKNEKAKVNGWQNLKLVPDNFKDIEALYGKDIADQALEKTYQNKIHDNFSRWDERNDKAVSLREQLKAVSPEEQREARNKLDEFNKKQNEILQVLQKKSEELEAKGIDFSPDYASGFGSKYQEIIGLDSRGTIGYITESLNKNDFPPQHDFVKLQETINKRIEQISQFGEVIKNIKNEEDVENLLKNRHSDVYVGKFFNESLNTDLRERVWFKLGGNNNGAVRKLTDKCKTYRQAEDYLNEIIKKNTEAENKVSEAMINIVKAQLKTRELEVEIKQEKIGQGTYDLNHKIEEMARDKKEATKVMGEIEALLSQLSRDPKISEENLTLSGSYLVVPSIKKEYDELRENAPIKKREWDNKKREREKYEVTKPGLFGKEKWQKKLTELKADEETARTEHIALENKDQSALYKKAYHGIESDQYSSIGKMVNACTAQGKISEIFNGLKTELTKVIDTTLPPKIMEDYAEYKTLIEKIN